MVKEFKEFISRGNIIDLAVGVIIGGAFTSIVNALTTNVITPLIGLLISIIFPGNKNVDDATKNLTFMINRIEFNYGLVISAAITFLITAVVLFMIIKGMNKANGLIQKPKKDIEEVITEEQETVEEILVDIKNIILNKSINNNK